MANPETGAHPPMPDMGNTEGKIYGKVIETIDTSNYTYVLVDDGKQQYWAATSPVALDNGSMVSFVPNMPMNNFTSKTLDRTFDVVYFVGQVYTDKIGDHSGMAGSAAAKPVDTAQLENIKKPDNGVTIDELLKQKQQLAGQTIIVRGVVVKFTPQVMEKNWVHIRDSSTSKDLTLTTSASVKEGDVILVSGKLQLDKDFGYGYVYDVLLEDSTITVE